MLRKYIYICENIKLNFGICLKESNYRPQQSFYVGFSGEEAKRKQKLCRPDRYY